MPMPTSRSPLELSKTLQVMIRNAVGVTKRKLRVGTMAEAVKLYQEIGFPALQKGSHDKKLVGYFQADTGTINQILHLWKFDDDAGRRAHWAAVYANKDFVEGFASKFRPLLITQEVKLLQAAPWGPHP
jgi:hypothetical protein